MVPLQFCTGAHADGVRSRSRLADGQRTNVLPWGVGRGGGRGVQGGYRRGYRGGVCWSGCGRNEAVYSSGSKKRKAEQAEGELEDIIGEGAGVFQSGEEGAVHRNGLRQGMFVWRGAGQRELGVPGHRQSPAGANMRLTRYERRQVFLLLLLVAVAHQLVDAQVAVGAVAEADGA